MRKMSEKRKKKKKTKKTKEKRRRRQRKGQMAKAGMRKGTKKGSLGRIGSLLQAANHPDLSRVRPERGHQRQELRGQESGKGSSRGEEMERDVVSQESDFPIRLVRQGGRDNRNLSKRGKQRRGKRRRSRGPKRKRKRRRGKKVGRSRLRSLQSVGTRGGKDKSIADEEEEEEEDGAGEERRLRRRMKKLRRSRQLYLEQEQYR